jgi:hypothetical protein
MSSRSASAIVRKTLFGSRTFAVLNMAFPSTKRSLPSLSRIFTVLHLLWHRLRRPSVPSRLKHVDELDHEKRRAR